MGRTEASHAPSIQQGHRKDQRAKAARQTINKTVPQLLASDALARNGISKTELITSSPLSSSSSSSSSSSRRRKKSKDLKLQDDNTQVSSQSTPIRIPKTPTSSASVPLKIRILATDTLLAAQHLHKSNTNPKSRKNITVLNMASPLRPGGGVLNGATSQEESLCSRTTLLPSLREEWYRLPELGGIWSPDVLVFKSGLDVELLPRQERFHIDVVSASMLRFPDVVDQEGSGGGTAEKVYANPSDRELVVEKIKAILNILLSKSSEKVVLGAWGCGAYGNPVGEIVRAWKKVLLGSKLAAANWAPLKEVVFAIKDAKMAESFAMYWGDGVRVETLDCKGANEEVEDDAEAKELEEKIQNLETQIEQVKTPLLREGLENTLRALRTRLGDIEPGEGDDDGADESDAESVR